ncbi:MAG TPA: hypothetical protein VKI62_10205 [Bacteroidota bacterium]|nr:hypothetical protein [Bacteroidota bacterium]
MENKGERFRQKPTKWLIGQENHEPTEGDEYIGIHFHCYFEYKEPIRIRNPRYFDINANIEEEVEEGVTVVVNKVFHPNVQSARKSRDVARYCAKKDDYIASDNFDLLAKKKRSFR